MAVIADVVARHSAGSPRGAEQRQPGSPLVVLQRHGGGWGIRLRQRPYPDRMSKKRLTVSVDVDVAAAGAAAVAQGRAESLSGWVNEALVDKVAKDLRLAALAGVVAAYEAEHGVIGHGELAEQARADRDAAAAARAAVQRPGAA
jgi:hypothetical protein